MSWGQSKVWVDRWMSLLSLLNYQKTLQDQWCHAHKSHFRRQLLSSRRRQNILCWCHTDVIKYLGLPGKPWNFCSLCVRLLLSFLQSIPLSADYTWLYFLLRIIVPSDHLKILTFPFPVLFLQFITLYLFAQCLKNCFYHFGCYINCTHTECDLQNTEKPILNEKSKKKTYQMLKLRNSILYEICIVI